jgi:Carboxypeptidase regulatory-like domain
MRNLLKNLLLLGLISLLPVAALGQAISGDLVGIVKDPSGAVVAGATVEATNLATGLKKTDTSSSSGEFHFVNLPAGHYSLQAQAGNLKGGYADIEVTLNKIATANIQTSIAGTATTVEVTGEVATIDTTTANIGTTFEAKEAADLPTTSTGSGVLNLSLLNAGVATTGGIGVGSGPSVSGQRPRNNNFTVEGVDNNSISVTGPLIQIPNDAVEQFTVLQNDYSPEFGHSSGGQFNQTVKSGTNQFHGRLYEYFQNRNLNAENSQDALSQVSNGEKPFVPRYDNNRYGGQFGGPIIKNKLFFFTDWEYNPTGLSGSASTACAPTAAGYAALGALFPGNNNLATLQKYVAPAGSQATSPSDICSGAGYNFTPGLVGVSQVTPGTPSTLWGTGTSFVNIPIGDVGFAGPYYYNSLNTANSFDWNISEKDQVRGRLGWSRFGAIDNAAQIPTFWATTPQRYWLATLSEYHNFSPNVNNELRAGYNRYAQVYPTGSQTFPGLSVFPNLQFYELNGLQLGPDGNAPQETIQNLYQFVDNVTWVKGKHSFKFGGEFRWYISPQTFTQRVRGDYQWNYLSDYLNDFAPNPNQGDFAERSAGNVVYYGNRKAIYWYAGDTWRVTPKFTFTYGVRYEWTGEPLAATTLQPLNSISNVPGLITFGAPTTQKANFMPRVGVAYAPDPNTSIHAGFTMANDVLFDNLGILSLPPQVSQTCDTLPPGGGGQSASCFWSNTNFLASGGLPSNPTTITDPAVARGATGAYIPNQQLPYTETFNIGIQHLFANKYTLDVRFVSTRGIHLPVQTRLNKTTPVTASNNLPTYLTAPSQATLDSLPLTLAELKSGDPSYLQDWLNAGFTGNVVAFEPYGGSKYNGLQTQLSRNFTNGLQFQLAWTWSHALDNSTAEVFSTVLTPRRPQNFQCLACDWSTSAYDRRHRVTLQAMYDVPFYKSSSNWMMKNVVGNWEIAPIYTFQSPEYATCQSGTDSNLNGDPAPDRCIYNPFGVPGTSSNVTALHNSDGATVAYLANDPTAQYIQARSGAFANAPRNTLAAPHTNNVDLTFLKRLNITERQVIEFQFQATNVFNHAQYVPGYISDVAPLGYTGGNVRSVLLTGSSTFNNWSSAFTNHPRNLVLVLKYSF